MRKLLTMMLFSGILAVLLAVGVASQDAQAHKLADRSAANTNGQIVVQKANNMFQDGWADTLNYSMGDWNTARNDTGNTNFGVFLRYENFNINSTLRVALYSAQDSTYGYYQHEPGPTVDKIMLNAYYSGPWNAKQRKKTVVHELGHAAQLAHPGGSGYCFLSVMVSSMYCTGDDYVSTPAQHDYTDVGNLTTGTTYNDSTADTVVLDEEAEVKAHYRPGEGVIVKPKGNARGLIGKVEFKTIDGKKVKVSETIVDENTGAFTVKEFVGPKGQEKAAKYWTEKETKQEQKATR